VTKHLNGGPDLVCGIAHLREVLLVEQPALLEPHAWTAVGAVRNQQKTGERVVLNTRPLAKEVCPFGLVNDQLQRRPQPIGQWGMRLKKVVSGSTHCLSGRFNARPLLGRDPLQNRFP